MKYHSANHSLALPIGSDPPNDVTSTSTQLVCADFSTPVGISYSVHVIVA